MEISFSFQCQILKGIPLDDEENEDSEDDDDPIMLIFMTARAHGAERLRKVQNLQRMLF